MPEIVKPLFTSESRKHFVKAGTSKPPWPKTYGWVDGPV